MKHLVDRPNEPTAPVCADKELASDYELDVETQHVPMGVYTRAVDYPDGDVQVGLTDGSNDIVEHRLESKQHCSQHVVEGEAVFPTL